jgi:putative monooxygenase
VTTREVKKVPASQVEANRRRGGDVRVTLSPKTVGSTSGFGGVMWLAPGDWVSEHYHPYSEEFVHVIGGRVELVVAGVAHELAAGDSLMVPINVRHRMVNLGDAVAHLVFHLSPLAPRPELGHVDTEPTRHPDQTQPEVGGSR